MDQRLQSYLGILSHANQHKLSQALKNAYWVRPVSEKNQKIQAGSAGSKRPKSSSDAECQWSKFQGP